MSQKIKNNIKEIMYYKKLKFPGLFTGYAIQCQITCIQNIN